MKTTTISVEEETRIKVAKLAKEDGRKIAPYMLRLVNKEFKKVFKDV